MTEFTDVMVDCETTGTSPDRNAMIQLAAVKFNPVTMQIDTANMFDRCLDLMPNRFWDEDTRRWWMEGSKREVLKGIVFRMEDPKRVLEDFVSWAAPVDGQRLRFWAKPISFDYPFVQSHIKDVGLQMPFGYWEAKDLRSVLYGLHYPEPAPEIPVEFQGDAHNALHDTLHQILVLFTHLGARTSASRPVADEGERGTVDPVS